MELVLRICSHVRKLHTCISKHRAYTYYEHHRRSEIFFIITIIAASVNQPKTIIIILHFFDNYIRLPSFHRTTGWSMFSTMRDEMPLPSSSAERAPLNLNSKQEGRQYYREITLPQTAFCNLLLAEGEYLFLLVR